jgi:hypothetical protein
MSLAKVKADEEAGGDRDHGKSEERNNGYLTARLLGYVLLSEQCHSSGQKGGGTITVKNGDLRDEKFMVGLTKLFSSPTHHVWLLVDVPKGIVPSHRGRNMSCQRPWCLVKSQCHQRWVGRRACWGMYVVTVADGATLWSRTNRLVTRKKNRAKCRTRANVH